MEKTKIKALTERFKLRKCRKGNIVDMFLIIAFMFALGVMIFAVWIMLSKVGDSGLFNTHEESQQVYTMGINTILSFDNLALFVLIGLSLFVIISSALVWNHPAFLIIGLILLAVAILVAGVVSNAWFDFSGNSTINDAAGAFPKLHFLLQQLPFYILLMGIAASIASYIGFKGEYG